MVQQISQEDLETGAYHDFCYKHDEFWAEDGCPDCAAEAGEAERRKPPIQYDADFVHCSKHGTRYWSEDECPDCLWEYEEEEEKRQEEEKKRQAEAAIRLRKEAREAGRRELANAVVAFLRSKGE